MTGRSDALPGSDIDLFANDVLADPYPAYSELQRLGPVVRLAKYDCWALTNYASCREVLDQWSAFSSARGLGLNDAVNSLERESVLMSDPPRHDQLRAILVERLGPRALRGVVPDICRRARELVDAAVSKGEFDAVADIARRLPVEVVSDLIGLPQEGREELLALADGTFNSFGPDNERARAGMHAWSQQAALLRRIATRDRIAAGSLGMAVYEAADAGELDPQDCLVMLGTYLNAGMDTTVNAVAAALALLSAHPDQLDAMRSGEVAPAAAFEEAVRFESPVQTFSRMTVTPRLIGEVNVPSGQRVAVLYGCANRDPARWDHPGEFDVRRPARQHLGFGSGIHSCAGQALARIEGAAVIEAFAAHDRSMTLVGADWHLNNVIRGLGSARIAVG